MPACAPIKAGCTSAAGSSAAAGTSAAAASAAGAASASAGLSLPPAASPEYARSQRELLEAAAAATMRGVPNPKPTQLESRCRAAMAAGGVPCAS